MAGDGHNALAILEAITEAYVADWVELDDSDGEAGAFFADLGAVWTEAILTADLTIRGAPDLGQEACPVAARSGRLRRRRGL